MGWALFFHSLFNLDPRPLSLFYLDMNRLALQAVVPGGIFLTCSCTGLVSEADFLETLRRAAWQAGRTVQVLRVAGAAPDHPFLLHAQEGRYLKAVYCRVE
jgi:23S rRNA (cytosine1962-C5)-methyltransferase